MSNTGRTTSEVWVCLACKQKWDTNRRKTKLCPTCECMGVCADDL